MHIIVGDTFLRLKLSQLPSSTHFERMRSKYMGQRTPKGWERKIWRMLTNFGNDLRRGDSKKKVPIFFSEQPKYRHFLPSKNGPKTTLRGFFSQKKTGLVGETDMRRRRPNILGISGIY
jgi:hypothetical protein